MRNMVLSIDTNVLLNYIITCNVKDFVHGDVEARTPREFLQLLRKMDFQ